MPSNGPSDKPGAVHLVWGALALFSIVFVWQLPHVYAIAVMYRDDYDRGGLTRLPAASRHGGNHGRHIVAWSALLILASVSPTTFGIAGASAALGGVVLALYVLRQGAHSWWNRRRNVRGKCCWHRWFTCRWCS